MNNTLEKKKQLRKKRTMRVRQHVQGNSTKPRLCVVKTNCHIHVQLIDDENRLTLGSISTISKEFRETEFNKRNKASARKLGVRIGEIAKEKSIEKVVFDRGPSKYHGVLAEVAEGARSAGLQF